MFWQHERDYGLATVCSLDTNVGARHSALDRRQTVQVRLFLDE